MTKYVIMYENPKLDWFVGPHGSISGLAQAEVFDSLTAAIARHTKIPEGRRTQWRVLDLSTAQALETLRRL